MLFGMMNINSLLNFKTGRMSLRVFRWLDPDVTDLGVIIIVLTLTSYFLARFVTETQNTTSLI